MAIGKILWFQKSPNDMQIVPKETIKLKSIGPTGCLLTWKDDTEIKFCETTTSMYIWYGQQVIRISDHRKKHRAKWFVQCQNENLKSMTDIIIKDNQLEEVVIFEPKTQITSTHKGVK